MYYRKFNYWKKVTFIDINDAYKHIFLIINNTENSIFSFSFSSNYFAALTLV